MAVVHIASKAKIDHLKISKNTRNSPGFDLPASGSTFLLHVLSKKSLKWTGNQ